MLLEVFPYLFLGFADVDGEKDQSFGRKLLADLIDKGGLIGAEAAPGGPEFEQNHFALDGLVVEFLAGGRGGGKVRSGFLVFGAGSNAESTGEQGGCECAADEHRSHAHDGNIAQIGGEGLRNRGWKLGTEE